MSMDVKKVPQHVAMIMDGNGRWANQQGRERVYGHQNGVEAVRSVIEGAGECGIRYLTLYAFSSENWNRPKEEVDALMELLVASIHNEMSELQSKNVRLKAIGEISQLPSKTLSSLQKAMEDTADNKGLTVVLALSYGSRQEMISALKHMVDDCIKHQITPEDINEKLITSYLDTSFMPDPEILIRTGGEHRLSNFLLWQSSYTELFFSDKMWPDFRKQDLFDILDTYKNIERRFGKTSQQLKQA